MDHGKITASLDKPRVWPYPDLVEGVGAEFAA
jgi:hypothetical protein